MPFASKLRVMIPSESKSQSCRSQVLDKIAEYMNKKHSANYSVYNLYQDRQLDHAANFFHQITEYPFPKASMVLKTADTGFMHLSTPPPTLRQLFLVVLEMASWINLDEQEHNVILLHQSDLYSSNSTMVLSCLVSLLNRDLFQNGPKEALPFITNLAQNFPYTKMSLSQERYMNYFS